MDDQERRRIQQQIQDDILGNMARERREAPERAEFWAGIGRAAAERRDKDAGKETPKDEKRAAPPAPPAPETARAGRRSKTSSGRRRHQSGSSSRRHTKRKHFRRATRKHNKK